MIDKHVVALLEIQLKHDIRMDKLDKALGKWCEIYEMFPLDLLDIVADLLGVPEDTSEHGKDDHYCREWVFDRWYNCRGLEDPINGFIDIMREDTEEYYKMNIIKEKV